MFNYSPFVVLAFKKFNERNTTTYDLNKDFKNSLKNQLLMADI